MAFELDVKIKGDKKLQRKLRKVGIALDDFSTELKRSGTFLRDFFREDVFNTAGGVFGENWAPLKPSTVRQKGSSRKLVDSGRMKNAFRFRSTKDIMVLSNSTDYLRFHQFGTRKMPRRIVIKLDAQRKDKILDIFQKGMNKRLRRVWNA